MTGSTAHSDSARRLKERLRHELRWLRARLIGHAAVMLIAGLGLLLLVAILASGGWTSLGPWGARLVQMALFAAFGWIVFFEVIRPLRGASNLMRFSRLLERHGHYDNLLEAATQFTSPRRFDPLRQGASPDLVAEILRRACHEAETTVLSPKIPLSGAPAHVLVAAVALVGWLVVGLGQPERVATAFYALSHPAELRDFQPQEGLYSLTRDLRVPVGGAAKLASRDFVGGEEPVIAQINRSGDFWQELPTQAELPALDPAPYSDAVLEVNEIEDPFRYRFRKGHLVTPAFEVSVRERPVLKAMNVRLEPPAYTGKPARDLDDVGGTISVLEGTKVFLTGEASVPLSAAARLTEGAAAIPLAIDGATFTDEFVVSEDLSFKLGLTDQEGLENLAITVYRFAARPDDPPTIEITKPGEDVSLDRDLRVSIAAIAADDVGLSRIELLYRSSDETDWSRARLFARGQSVPASEDLQDLRVDEGEQEMGVGFVWDLGSESLFPGDTMLYCLEATDNNALVGGQSTRSAVYRLRLPTIAEVFDVERTEREEHGEDLTDMLEEGEELKDTLERLNRELMKNPTPDWAKQQEIKDALERQQAMREKLSETSEQLQQSLDEFQKNNAGSMEILEKMQTIQDLLSEINDESLQAYLEAMQEAMDQLQPHEIQRAMEDALANQEEYNRRLDRTIELLRQLERERIMSDLVEEAAEHLARQEQLQEETAGEDPKAGESPDESELAQGEEESQDEEASSEESPTEDAKSGESESQSGEQREMSDEELAEAQERLAEEAKALEEKLREVLEELKQQREQSSGKEPGASQMQEALEEAQDQMSQDGEASRSMEEAARELQEGQRGEAQEQQSEAMKKLLHLYEVLAQGQQGMQMATSQHAVERLQQLAYDLLNLSFSEERMIDSLDESVRGQRVAPITREQGRILRATTRLSDELHDLARQNFMISEGLLEEMRALVDLLDNSVEELELARSRRSRDTATTTMGRMNRIVMNLLTAAQSASQGGGGSSQQMSISQQMQQMSEDQSRLNRMTEQLRDKLQGGLTPQERQQLAELRARQQAIQQQLEDVRKEIEDERRILGDLDELEDDIQEVVEDLQTGELTPDTQRQQEKILSRLLDAQRSIRERDFAKRRESRQSDQLFGDQEGTPLATGFEDHEAQLRRWLAPEAAPHAYQDDVRQYFRRIQGVLEQGDTR